MHNLSTLPMAAILFFSATLAALYLVPRIRGVLNYKKFRESPNKRSSHTENTPNLGGIAFFTIMMVAFYFIHPYDEYNEIMSLIPGLTILFIAGMKDDLVVLSPGAKLFSQLMAAAFLVYHYKFSIESMHGFMGIEGMPAWLGAIFGILIIIAVINALNLIDGIDGLASTVGIIMFAGFSVMFYLAGKDMLMLTSITMIGIIAGFLPYNLSKKKKIFMGDTGSMIVGFMLGSMAVRMLAFDYAILEKLPFHHENLPLVVLALLALPLFDTARVFCIRVLNHKSPFKPDRNHIHHIVIDCFRISHRRASFFIGLTNFIIILGFSLLAMRASQLTLILSFAMLILTALVFFFVLKKRIVLQERNHKYAHRPQSIRTSLASEPSKKSD